MIDVAPMSRALSQMDAVFLGEVHNSDQGHRYQQQILEQLHQARPDLILSMEMFERDVQKQLDDYLAGRIDEQAFLAAARPWPNYAAHYRPMIEYARSHRLPVLAANVPRSLARKVSSEGLAALTNTPHAARTTSAPKDAYWTEFEKTMAGHVGAERMELMYQAQCLKDDTMAESIHDAVVAGQNAGRRPLVVHLCGAFHSDYRRGTVDRLQSRGPGLKIGVVTMVNRKDQEAKNLATLVPTRADYALVVTVPEEKAPKIDKPATTQPVAATSPHRTDNAPVAKEPSTQQPAATGGRPALGLMPAYDSQGGMGVETVTEGGPAAKAGIQAGDVILKVGNKNIEDVQSYMQALAALTPGQVAKVVVRRDGKERDFDVTVGTRPQ